MRASLPITQARDSLGEIVNRVALRGERVALSRNGKEIAAIVSIEDLELIRRLEDRIDNEAADAALAEGGTPIPLEDLKRELGL